MEKGDDMKLLETIGLTISFGGLVALDEVNFSLGKGELRGIIGPNGAGKTTFFNVITGHLKPTKGKTFLDGEDISGLPPHTISQKGISRTFQITNIFPEMTVHESIWAGLNSRTKQPWNPFVRADTIGGISRKAEEICQLVGLSDKMNQISENLSHGDQRVLEIAIALSTDPILLLLDEPTQGVSPKEIDNLLEVIEKVSHMTTTILIEHDMTIVLSVSNAITVFNEGRIIAGGSPSEISESEEVQKIYLGIG
ncbi:MAG: ABC transporter ATP-binding protein [Deltaproteobacteria bacterium]|nr:ABC transporter ATP-binding protein [Deltaproteobacteria bacterium]